MPARPSAPRLEDHQERVGLPVPSPRLSWTTTAPPGWRQLGYEVEATVEGTAQTVEVRSPDQVLVPWPFAPLASRTPVSVRVRLRGADGWSDWSDPTATETALLSSDDVVAELVSPDGIGGLDDPAVVLATTFTVDGPVDRARLHATAQGIYTATINGERVGDVELAPGWTAYRHRLLVQTYDVTDLLVPGENHLELLLGNGWFRGNIGRPPRRDLYGDRTAALAQLEFSDAGGPRTVVTDGSWTARDSVVRSDDLYDGQVTDLTLTDLRTAGVQVREFDRSVLAPQSAPPVRVVAQVRAQEIFTTPSGKQVVDFGQNVAGRVRLSVRGARTGDTVVLRHAEVLEHGELGTRPLRTARATDEWTLPAGDVVLEPTLTFHGFRYAEVTGVRDLRLEDAVAVVISSDLERTGWFESSDPVLDRLHENVVWGMRGNFVSVPTDCPQRDERMGWTGDIQVFAPTASFLFDSRTFLTSWLEDLRREQDEEGYVPYVVPDVFRRPGQAATAWGDAATVVPTVLAQRFDDVEVLRHQFDSMRGWADLVWRLAGDDHVWSGGFQYGDWLDPTAPPDDPAKAMTAHDLVATAHVAHSSRLVAAAAHVLGDTGAHDRYAERADLARTAFARNFVTASGRMTSDSQTAYALAIAWDLFPDEASRTVGGDRLADLVRGVDFTIGTGFVGTPLVLDALTDAGHLDVAYRLLLSRQNPSWLYSVSMGATTIWERWDSMLPDGTINPGQMTSFNHYAFGAVADWLHRVVAGLAPSAPGYRRLRVEPRPGGGLTRARARHRTPYGTASVAWTLEGREFHLDVEVPVGVTADVVLPDGSTHEVEHGSHHLRAHLPPDGERADVVRGRDLVDDPDLWAAVVAAAVHHRPAWTGRDVASAVSTYFDRPAQEIPRIVGRSTITPEEVEFSATLSRLIRDRAR